MSIYSNDRSGYTKSISVAENANYSDRDFCRILYENERNDMAIFEGMVFSDLYECRARQNGTLLESEITAFTEEAEKGFFKKLVEVVKTWWAKIKRAFRVATDKIASYLVKLTKTDKIIEKLKKGITSRNQDPNSVTFDVKGVFHNDKIKLPKILELSADMKNLIDQGTDGDFLKHAAAQYSSVSGDSAASTVANYKHALYVAAIGANAKSDVTYNEKSFRAAIKEEPFMSDEKLKLNDLANLLSPGDNIKQLKEAEKLVDKATQKLLSAIESASSSTGKNAPKAKNIVSAFQQAMTTIISCKIWGYRHNIFVARLAIHTYLSIC